MFAVRGERGDISQIPVGAGQVQILQVGGGSGQKFSTRAVLYFAAELPMLTNRRLHRAWEFLLRSLVKSEKDAGNF